jgi:hypothetical protein
MSGASLKEVSIGLSAIGNQPEFEVRRLRRFHLTGSSSAGQHQLAYKTGDESAFATAQS